jgi:hypothetical protein
VEPLRVARAHVQAAMADVAAALATHRPGLGGDGNRLLGSNRSRRAGFAGDEPFDQTEFESLDRSMSNVAPRTRFSGRRPKSSPPSGTVKLPMPVAPHAQGARCFRCDRQG